MNRIILICIFLLFAVTVTAQTELVKWQKKYYSELVPLKVKKKNRSLIVSYDSLLLVDTINVKNSISGNTNVRLQRRIKLNVKRQYRKDILIDTITLYGNAINYYEILGSSGVTVPISLSDGLYQDVNIPVNYTKQNDVTAKAVIPVHTDIVFSDVYVTDTLLSRREIVNAVGDLDPNNWYFGFNFTPAVAYRNTSINTNQYADALTQVFTRDTTETSDYGQSLSVQAGYTFNATNTIYAEFMHIRYGFSSTRSLDWRTGTDTTVGRTQYAYYGNGLGLGFNYSGYKNIVNVELDLGAYYTFMNIDYQGGVQYPDSVDNGKAHSKYLQSLGLHSNLLGVKAGLGLNIRPGYRLAIRCVPTIYYSLTPINNGSGINTRLYNVGLSIGLAIRPFHKVWSLN